MPLPPPSSPPPPSQSRAPPSGAPPPGASPSGNAAAMWRMRYASGPSPEKPPMYKNNRAKGDDDGRPAIDDSDDDTLSPTEAPRRRYRNGASEEDVIELEDFDDADADKRRRPDDGWRGGKNNGGRSNRAPLRSPPPTDRRENEAAGKMTLARSDPRFDPRFDPLKPTIFDARTIPFVLRKLHAFVMAPAPAGGGVVVRCFIERKKSWQHTLHPVYKLYADHEDGTGRLLIAARKMPFSGTAQFAFSTSADDLFKDRKLRSRHYLGKLKAKDAKQSDYVLYEAHRRPTDESAPREGGTAGPQRRELLAVCFAAKTAQNKFPRRIEAAVPRVTWRPGKAQGLHEGAADAVIFAPQSAHEGVLHALNNAQSQGAQNITHADRITVMHLRESRYDPLSSCLVDFKARANVASVKNFQLVKSPPVEDHLKQQYYNAEGAAAYGVDDPQPILLQMGKVGKDCFNMDYQFPLSLFQAFAICIARFDTLVR
ncbi:tubby C-terminal-like domain-containing protein [Pelagophyceae sp. CCMP2097]|nr:tubby C-terminal-like domain-containing protein [Pelagophyceae sp. CCMP2097]